MTFNERLTAIAGSNTTKVEVYEGGSWNNQMIPAVGNKDGALYDFTSLAIENQLYVFGNISVLNLDSIFGKIKLFLTKVEENIIDLHPQFGSLTEIQMADGKIIHH